MKKTAVRRKKTLDSKSAKKTKSTHATSSILVEQEQTLTIQQAIELAVQHHNAGDLPKAESIYQQILQADPNQPIVLHLLGVIAHSYIQRLRAALSMSSSIGFNDNYLWTLDR